MSYRHDFGLLEEGSRASTMFIAREWLRAWRKEFDVQPAPAPSPDVPDRLDDLWQEYCEAATASGSTENGGIDLYDIEGMDEAAYALFQYAQTLRAALARKWGA